MRIFITGASGFVGGATAKALQQDHQVMAMARSQKSEEKNPGFRGNSSTL